MTFELFSKWLNKLDAEIKFKRRKIISFIDNCSAHKPIPQLDKINVQILHPNTVVQPLDQGIKFIMAL